MCEISEGFLKSRREFGVQVMKRPKIKIWFGLLLGLFLGSLGLPDQVWCFKAGGGCDPVSTPCCPPGTPQSSCPCTGCSDSPAASAGFRSGHLRAQGAFWPNLQTAYANSLTNLLFPEEGYTRDLFSGVPSGFLNSFASLRTVILII
jgi:hypothetical protein